MINQLELKKLVAFSILMANGEGIKSKAPKYINEKYTYLISCDEEQSIRGILDGINQAKYDQWFATWARVRS